MFDFFKYKWKPTIVDRLNEHLFGMTQDEKIKELKSIVKEVCQGVNVSRNPRKRICDEVMETRLSI